MEASSLASGLSEPTQAFRSAVNMSKKKCCMRRNELVEITESGRTRVDGI